MLANNAFPSAPGVIGGEAASLAMTLLVLGIVCANVGSLRVGAAVVRRREIAMRLSLGATRGRVVRQLLTESVLIAVGAGILGLLLVAGIVRATATFAVPHGQFGYVLTPASLHPSDLVDGGQMDLPIAIAPARPIVAGWLDLMGIPIVAGRDFDANAPDRNAASIIIGADVARSWWGNVNPIGRRIVIGNESVRTVIGVLDEGAAGAGMTANGATVFIPMTGRVPLAASVRVRTGGPPDEVIPLLRSVVDAESTTLAGSGITTLAADLAVERRMVLLASSAFGAGGLLALCLSAIGLYGVVSLSVVQRTREIGIRMALGAGRANVIGLFLSAGLRICVLGMVVGMPLSLAGLRFLQSLGAPRTNIGGVAALVAASVLAVASLAIWIPAFRAATVDPLTSIRESG